MVAMDAVSVIGCEVVEWVAVMALVFSACAVSLGIHYMLDQMLGWERFTCQDCHCHHPKGLEK